MRSTDELGHSMRRSQSNFTRKNTKGGGSSKPLIEIKEQQVRLENESPLGVVKPKVMMRRM